MIHMFSVILREFFNIFIRNVIEPVFTFELPEYNSTSSRYKRSITFFITF